MSLGGGMFFDEEYHRRNRKNMRELMDMMLGSGTKQISDSPQPRETYTTREAAEQYAEGYLAGFVDASIAKKEDTECDYNLEQILSADEREEDTWRS